MSRIRPVSSARPMKRPGGCSPNSACCQRIKGLRSDDPAVREIDLRLVVIDELVGGERSLEFGRHLQPLMGSRLPLGRELAGSAKRVRLGVRQCRSGLADKRHGVRTQGAGHESNREPDLEIGSGQREPLGKR